MRNPGENRRHDTWPAVDAAPDRSSKGLDRGAHLDVGWTDDEAASDARRRYRGRGIEPLAPDPRIASLLEPHEDVLAWHEAVGLDRGLRSTHDAPSAAMRGDLYVTSARLVHIGGCVFTVALDDIEDAALVADGVMLVTRGGVGITVDTDRPRLLRVQVAAARAMRGASRPRP